MTEQQIEEMNAVYDADMNSRAPDLVRMSTLGIGDRFIHQDHPETVLTVYDQEPGRVVCTHLDLLGRHIEFNGEQMNQFVSLEYKGGK